MTKGTIESCIMQLGNVGIALSQIEVKGESNLNLLLASIQTVRDVKNALKEGEVCDDHDKQRTDV